MDTNKIRFFGDFTTCENYQAIYERDYKSNILRKKGYDYLLKDTKQLFEDSFNIVNLESPITNVIKSPLEGRKASIHWMDPDIAGEYLKKYGINAVTLGNNHGYDYGHEGLMQTIDILQKNNIEYFGAGINAQDAESPLNISLDFNGKSLEIFLIGGFKYREDYDSEYNFYAGKDKSGVNCLTAVKGCEQIKKIKQNNPEALVIMFPHFGFDLLNTVTHQIDYAHSWIDAGADFVIGHGPHQMNSIEYYKGKLICYSLGNFLFPASFYGRVIPYNLVAELNFSYNKKKGEFLILPKLYPTHLDNNSISAMTRPIKEDEIEEVLNHLSDDDDLKSKIKVHKGELIWLEI